ncbi:hypothetical protein CQW23_31075 [Capsicum baccatum]|uniref:Ubiquitin-like protease family profile domain-containing protein n=1 Tax=Capsicum baccatum TaxID=33114 RepID=A0A2G2V8L7_CAPBA|nr:hypothetical protein CQW23_31075 [Capsicum baccatum]
MKVDQKDKMTTGSLLLDDFTTPPPLGLLTRTKAKYDISLAPPSKRRKTNADKKESMIDQEKIKGHPYVKEVNEPPSGTSNTITDPINEEAPHEPSLIDFGEQTLTTKQNPPVVESGHESTQKINVSGGTYHEQVLMKVDMNAIESLVKTYLYVFQIVIEIDSSNKDVEKNETHGDDLGTPKEHPKDFPEKNDDVNAVYTGDHKRGEKPSTESSHKFNFDDSSFRRQTIEVQNEQKESETEVKNDAFQHSIDNTIADFSSPVSAIQSEELLQKENLPDLILPKNNIEVQNELQVSCTMVSSEAFQELIDNIIAGMSTPIVAMAVNSDDLSQKVNLPDLSLQMANVEDPNELPTEINDNEFQIYDTRFQLVLPEAEVGKQDGIKTRVPRNKKQTTIFRSPFTSKFGSSCKGKESATVDFSRKHPFDGYLMSHEMPMRLIEEYCDWIVEGLLKFHEKKELKDNHYKVNRSEIGFSSLDFVVAQSDSKNWFYTMSRHVNVIFYYLRKKSKQQKDQEYRYTTVNCLFKTYIDETYKSYFEDAAGDSLSTQDDYKKMCFVPSNEGALINIIKGFNIPAALPFHLVDVVYVPVNYDGNFHRVLVVISLKTRCIRVYDSMLSSQHREPSYKIKRLSEMLPTYISYSGLLKNIERTVWSSLESYKDKMSNVDGDLNDTPFDVEYVEDIAQQVNGSF